MDHSSRNSRNKSSDGIEILWVIQRWSNGIDGDIKVVSWHYNGHTPLPLWDSSMNNGDLMVI